MITKELHEKMEAYVAGQLSAADAGAFASQLLGDAQLAEQVRQYRLLADSFTAYGKRVELKKQLDGFHQEWKDESRDRPFIRTYGVRKFWRSHIGTVAVAASVAVVTVLGTVLITNYLRSLEHRQVNYYAELKKENNRIKKTLDAISTSMQQDDRRASYSASATGFMIASNGYIVTNRHVVNGADSVYVEAVDETDTKRRYKAKLIYIDPDPSVDLAMLKITDSTFRPLKYMPYALQTREADLGEKVYTLAYPREEMVFGEGSVSSHTGYEGDTSKYQVSIPVNPGNSGAPLLDEKGNLIGIVTAKNMNEESAAFAIKSKHLLTLIGSIPADSLPEPIITPRKNYMHYMRRPDQIKKLQGLVFNVKVYNSEK